MGIRQSGGGETNPSGTVWLDQAQRPLKPYSEGGKRRQSSIHCASESEEPQDATSTRGRGGLTLYFQALGPVE
jgi:hypothetical protein